MTTKYDYQPGTKSVLVAQGSRARVIILGVGTLIDMGRLGYLTGQALKDYEEIEVMNYGSDIS